MGNGTFEAVVETETILKSKNNHSTKVQEGFVVQIQSNSSHDYLCKIVKGDGWKIIATAQYYMTPTLPKINNLIAHNGVTQKNNF